MVTARNKIWRKNETRAVRPFLSSNDYLWEVALKLYPDEDFSAVEAIVCDEVDLAQLAVSIRVPKLSEEIGEIVGVAVKDLKLVVSIEDRTFKLREVAHQEGLASFCAEPQVVDLPPDIVQQMSWAGEMKIHVSLVLAKRRAGEVGTAERMGSWLASKVFTISRPKHISNFDIAPVDPDFFQTRGLPRSTTYYVEIADDDLNVAVDSLPQLLKVYIAKDVHAALGRDESAPISRAIVRSIHVDVVTTVLATGFRRLDGALESGSILDVVSRRLSKSSGLSVSTLERLAKDSAGAGLRAVVQSDVDLSRAFVSATHRRAV